jgi:TatD DNase family protein
VDVHCHLADPQFADDEDAVLDEAINTHKMEYIICNGIDPATNRHTLGLAERYPHIVLPAVGIYPLHACCHQLDLEALAANAKNVPPVERFDVDEEIEFIRNCAQNGRIAAIGECGLDRYFVSKDNKPAMEEQERVLRELMKVASLKLNINLLLDYSVFAVIQIGKAYDIPLILHSLRAEGSVFRMLQEEKVTKANFHCFCGKVSTVGYRTATFYLMWCRL